MINRRAPSVAHLEGLHLRPEQGVISCHVPIIASVASPCPRGSSAWVRRSRRACLHACLVSKRAVYMFALYSGSLAEPGDRNPYAGGESLVLPKLWMRGYQRMMRVRIETGPAMTRHLEARRDA